MAEISVCNSVSYLYSNGSYKDSYLHKTAYNVRRKEGEKIKKINQEQLHCLRKKAQTFNRKILSGKISINEARKEFGLLPKEGCDALITKVQ